MSFKADPTTEKMPFVSSYPKDKLFGVTRSGGREGRTFGGSGLGTLFRSNLDGSDYEIIHNFGHGPNNGTYPNNDLVVIGSTLYGSTLEGGEFEDLDPLMSEIGGGIVYSIPTDTNAVPEPSSSCVWFGLAAILVVVAHGTAKRRTVP